MRILTVFGTRPEAIKLAPVVHAFQATDGVVHATCVTGQHRQMLDQVLSVFRIVPEFDLSLMTPDQTLSQITHRALEGIEKVVKQFAPDWVVVQGDTTTAFAGALAAFYNKVKVAHVEAGLRTGNRHSPWPEEMNRRLVGQLADFHFPPTDTAAKNLAKEGVPPHAMLVTGNTVIDALDWVTNRLATESELRRDLDDRLSFLDANKRMILVTGHRRENFDGGLERVCRGLRAIAERGDVEIVYPVHLNPNVQSTAKAVLGNHERVFLIEPMDYLPFIRLMQRSHIIVTDSGGIQEEAPGLGKPVLVTRDTTERQEAIDAGVARLVGTDGEKLVARIAELLDDPCCYQQYSKAKNPFGDGRAASRIVSRLKQTR
jgi:UDP-N-acetylglucosamine 2-epimerase (non-hydrolysing)